MAVGAGLAVFGAGSYLYLASVARAVQPSEFSALSGLWLLINILGIGLFLPLEQELARAVSARRAAGSGGRPVVTRVAILGLAGLVAIAVVSWPMSDLLVNRTLRGDATLLVALWIGVVGYAFAFIQRGALAGAGQFGAYGRQLTWDGLVRGLGAPVMVGLGVDSPLAFALLLGLAPWVSILLTLRAVKPALAPGPKPLWSEVAQALGFLVVASFGSLVVGNAAALLIAFLGSSDDPGLVGRVVSASVLARLPAFMFVAVQAVLLPGLAHMAELGDWGQFRKSVLRISVLVLSVTAVTTGLAALWGTALLGAVFGHGAVLSTTVLVLLTLGSGLSMLAAILGQALVVMRLYRTAAAAWAAGLLAIVVAALLGGSALTRSLTGFLAGMTVTTLWLLVATGRQVRAQLADARTATGSA